MQLSENLTMLKIAPGGVHHRGNCLIFHRFPMVFLWFSYGFPMVFHGFPSFSIVFPWFSHGFPMLSVAFFPPSFVPNPRLRSGPKFRGQTGESFHSMASATSAASQASALTAAWQRREWSAWKNLWRLINIH